MMKNNIKYATVKFWDDLLYFQHFMQNFVFAPNQRLSTPLGLNLTLSESIFKLY